ncbi:MAG: hypothetical protein ACI8O8_002844 [Oleiphilaceae bacterium]|jgi:hypothetical protein
MSNSESITILTIVLVAQMIVLVFLTMYQSKTDALSKKTGE